MIDWLEPSEECILEIGYVIGFFNADGYLSVNKNGNFEAGFIQKTTGPLDYIQSILKQQDINSELKTRTKDGGSREMYYLVIEYSDMPEFIRLFDGQLFGQKLNDFQIFKELVEIYENCNKRNWKAVNEEEIREIHQKWRSNREKYKNNEKISQ